MQPPNFWLHSCAKKCQDCIDCEYRHSRLRMAGRYPFMQANEMGELGSERMGQSSSRFNNHLGFCPIPDDPVSPIMLSRDAKKLLQSGALIISEFASTN